VGIKFTLSLAAVVAGLLTLTLAKEFTAPALGDRALELTLVDARTHPSKPKVCCLSGADTRPDRGLLIVSDRSTLYTARLDTSTGTLTLTSSEPLTLASGVALPEDYSDAEGMAIGAGGNVHISFEGRHRVDEYTDTQASTTTKAPAHLDLPTNGGLEALAVDAGGALYALPETASGGAFQLLRLGGGSWRTVGEVPRSGGFVPVGADFDAGGALYVLERKFSFFMFQSRVRRLTLGAGGILSLETIWQSELGEYDNLEAVAVIEGEDGTGSLLMVSDDNAMPFQETQALLLALSE